MMSLLWGDIHNHCGITYGFGSLEHALNIAGEHLDFCAVTGHAMWPDMPDLCPETEYLIRFHQDGFKKLRDHWEEVRALVNKYNKDGQFITFQSYEMHSGEFGDHHLLSPDSDVALAYADSPALLLERLKPARGIMIPHHIGYTPGYRGINWDHYDSRISPVVEVYSKHGCGMSDLSSYPYYHDMGPRDSRNTVYEGLRRGYRFGFVGSTDHHAGFPGSYGDGKAAVWSEEKTRAAIYRAICNRQTYAVTGDRIGCDFKVNGQRFGSIVNDGSGIRSLDLQVEAGHFLDKVVVFKNLKAIHVINGELLPDIHAAGRYKVRLEMGWGNSNSLYTWNGHVKTCNGRLTDVEPCFRGRSILAPEKDMTAGDDVNLIEDKIIARGPESVEWVCQTVKNVTTLHPSTSHLILEIEGSPATVLGGEINGKAFAFSIGELLRHGYSDCMQPYNAESFKIHQAVPQSRYQASLCLEDRNKETEHDFYHVEVRQMNGDCAFITPVYFEG